MILVNVALALALNLVTAESGRSSSVRTSPFPTRFAVRFLAIIGVWAMFAEKVLIKQCLLNGLCRPVEVQSLRRQSRDVIQQRDIPYRITNCPSPRERAMVRHQNRR